MIKNLSSKNFLLIIFASILVLIASFRPVGLDHDSVNYINYLISEVPLGDFNLIDKEPTFWLIKLISDQTDEYRTVIFFFFYSFIAIYGKAYVISANLKNKLFAFFIYFTLFFVLHDMTQIRVGAAIALFLISITFYVKKMRIRSLIFLNLSVLFHYSAVIGLLMYALSIKRLNKKIYIGLPLAAFFLHLSGFDFISSISRLNILPGFWGDKLELYIILSGEKFSEINKFNLFYLSIAAIYITLLIRLPQTSNECDVLCLKLLGVGISSFYLFSSTPTVAFRISEFFFSTLILLIPSALTWIGYRSIYLFIISTWCTLYFIHVSLGQNINYDVLLK